MSDAAQLEPIPAGELPRLRAAFRVVLAEARSMSYEDEADGGERVDVLRLDALERILLEVLLA